MKTSLVFIQCLLLPLFILSVTHLSTAKSTQTLSQPHGLDHLLTQLSQWRKHQPRVVEYSTVLAWILCFMAASVSSAGGLGGGSLYLPILNLVAGLDLKTATSYSAFMVTSASLSNVLYNIFLASPGPGGKSLINYEICLLLEPCMLLGVSIGVLCNLMFPEWLITVLFAAFLACSTYKTCASGFKRWKLEMEEVRRVKASRIESARGEEDEKGMEEPLLAGGEDGGLRIPWKDVVVLILIWLSFCVLHVLQGDENGKGVINIRPCGVAYWLITLSQVPLAIAFMTYILYDKKKNKSQHQSRQQIDGKGTAVETRFEALPMFVFPSVALLTGVCSGIFGIGGGLVINPMLLQIGLPPQNTAATTIFMVLFSASMSTIQYAILGMKGIDQATIYAMVCFVASAIGLAILQRAVTKSGRVSLIVFMVSMVMALSLVSITFFGGIDAWRQYTSGSYMGFKPLC